MDTPSRAAMRDASDTFYSFFYLSACVGGLRWCQYAPMLHVMHVHFARTLHVYVYVTTRLTDWTLSMYVCLSIGLLALELLSQFSYSLCLLCGWTLTQNRVIILCIMNALHQCLCLNRGLSNNLVVYCKLITNDAKFFIYQWCIGFVIMNFPRLEFYYSIKKKW